MQDDHDHDHAHDHDHDHDHGHHHGIGGHSHAPADYGRAFAIGFALNLAYVIGEAFYGVAGHSLALLADAGHNLSDVLGLAGAWGATWLGQKLPGGRYTYGLRRSSILTALGQCRAAVGGYRRHRLGGCSAPGHARASGCLRHHGGAAAVGIVVNGVTALLFMSGRKGDLN